MFQRQNSVWECECELVPTQKNHKFPWTKIRNNNLRTNSSIKSIKQKTSLRKISQSNKSNTSLKVVKWKREMPRSQTYKIIQNSENVEVSKIKLCSFYLNSSTDTLAKNSRHPLVLFPTAISAAQLRL